MKNESMPTAQSPLYNLIQEPPDPKDVISEIGHYQILELIGKGGMGEVFLAYDKICGRRIALKKVRSNLLDHKQVNNRFLKEAHITSQLTHPSIIPIYSIHKEGNQIYYTMPFVQGETLKQTLKDIRKITQKGRKAEPHGGSIVSLIRIFINVCQAIAYAHSKNVLHRDLKPENIIIGQYGEVLILDWGLAKLIRSKEEGNEPFDDSLTQTSEHSNLSGITKLGKVVGTVNYMAPERAMGNASSCQTDIYSLGVILYQILTLKYPFIRGTLEEFKKSKKIEQIIDPIEIAPYREIPPILARVALKCLEVLPEDRFHSVDEMIHEIENYIDGRAEWFQVATLNQNDKEDWEFQEHIYLQSHLAVADIPEGSDWVMLMVSKASFAENILLEARVKLNENGNGVGFLFNVPEASERKNINDGYCLWISSETNRTTKLMRSTMEVIYAPEIALKFEEWYNVRIDKSDNIIHFYLNDKLQFSYISHIPLVGTHVGLISKDENYEIENFNISVGGQNITVKCLAVPDAFLANKKYEIALSEYRRIGYSFPGRAEGREALFRAGITLLEQAKNVNDKIQAFNYYTLALKEFEKLYKTAGAPLEYLGKAIVYQSMHEYDEEIKCFELGCRRYYKHPLISILHEQILFRMNECSRIHRKATYQFILLTLRLLPDASLSKHVKKLFDGLQKRWEKLPFIEEEENSKQSPLKKVSFSIKLAFWLNRPLIIEEIIENMMHIKPFPQVTFGNAISCLIKLGSIDLAEKILNAAIKEAPEIHKELTEDLLLMIHSEKKFSMEAALQYIESRTNSTFTTERTLLHLLEVLLKNQQESSIDLIVQSIKFPFSAKNAIYLDAILCWAYLNEGKWNEAAKVLFKYPLEVLTQEHSVLYILYGCWLLACEGKELAHIHFSSVLDTSFPMSCCLLAHYLNRQIQDNQIWMQRSFSWEKRQLFRQLQLYYRIMKNDEMESHFKSLEEQERLNV